VENHIKKLPTQDIAKSKQIYGYLRKQSAYTSKRMLTQFRACCEWAKQQEMITQNPFEGMSDERRVTPKQEIDPFSRQEEDAILRAFTGQHHENMIRFLFLSGCRTSEAIGLRWKDIAPDCQSFAIAGALVYVNGKRIRKCTKNRKVRTLKSNAPLESLLLSMSRQDPTQPVFLSQGGIEVNARFLWEVWSRTVKPLALTGEIRAYRPQYQTRHTAITRWLTAGVPVHEVARWAGNTPTVIYNHYAGYLGAHQIPE